MPDNGPLRSAAWRGVFALPLPLRRRVLYTYYHRRLPNLSHPRTFTEKINWRVLHDRRPVIGMTCDKLRVKEQAERVGVKVARTLWSGTDVCELARADIAGRWVLKPNHRSQLVHFGSGSVTDTEGLQQITKGWLEEREGVGLGEWAYTQARPLLLVEEMLGGGAKPPPDYRFFAYGPDVRYVQVETGKPDDHRRRFYTMNWEPLEYRQMYPLAEPIPRPENFTRMVEAASALGAAFDFIRVDLYNIDGEIYLGELTPYPTGGMVPFTPRSFDLELGSHWQLPSKRALRATGASHQVDH